jgi:hypothetical protein
MLCEVPARAKNREWHYLYQGTPVFKVIEVKRLTFYAPHAGNSEKHLFFISY